MNVLLLILRRDLRIAFRRWGELATPLIFFVIVASLFPLALSPEESQLRDSGTGFLWIAALLSSLLALDGLFRSDMQDGSMEQLVLSPAPLALIVLGRPEVVVLLVEDWLQYRIPFQHRRRRAKSPSIRRSNRR